MSNAHTQSWAQEKLFLGMPFRQYLRTLLVPFNLLALLVLCVGIPLTWIRFTQGLGAVTNLSDNYPWGLWIGFDVLCGVTLAAGGFVIASVVHIFKLKDYYPIVRPAILTGFLGYFFVVVGLLYDLGQPLRLPYPVFVTFGVTSVMFLVAWHVFLYLTVQFIEFSPAIFEWLGWNKARRVALKLTIAATVLGVILSTLHQSSLGALFLIAPSKLHPLWYSSYLPIYFFISSIIAGLSMVIFEGALAHRFYAHKMDPVHLEEKDEVALGFGKAASFVLAGYFIIKVIGISAGNHWHLLGTGYGIWYLVELLGFVGLPCFLYAVGVREKNLVLIRWAAVLTVIGVVLNRLNISLIAFNWHLPSSERYFPHWMEIVISAFIVTIGLVAYRFIVSRMPIFYEHPDYKESH